MLPGQSWTWLVADKSSKKLVLLPGMDGTGLLFKPLIDALPDSIEIQIVSYSATEKQTYSELVEIVIKQLPKHPFVLLAESFSGPIAYLLSLHKNVPISQLILVASFLSNPFPRASAILRLLPLNILLSLPVPSCLLQYFCFGSLANDELLVLFGNSLKQVSSRVLAFRLRQILSIRIPVVRSSVDCLIITASSDRLISASISVDIKHFFIDPVESKISGAHFLAQTNVKELVRKLS